MPIHTEWYDSNQTVLLVEYSGAWTLAEMIEIQTLHKEWIGNRTDPIDLLLVFNEDSRIPDKVLSNLPRFAAGTFSNMGNAFIVGVNSRMLHTAIQLFSKVFRKLTVVETLEEAKALLSEPVD